MKTEEQAREKWCPIMSTRITSYSMAHGGSDAVTDPSRNRYKDRQPHNSCCCIASDCMAWRWAAVTVTNAAGTHYDPDFEPYIPDEWQDYELVDHGKQPDGLYFYTYQRISGGEKDIEWFEGFCGLAGKP